MARSENGGWKINDWQMGLVPPLTEPALNRERKDVAALLATGPKFPHEIATALELKPDTARKRLERMELDGQAEQLDDGRYGLPEATQEVDPPRVRPVQVSEAPAEVAA